MSINGIGKTSNAGGTHGSNNSGSSNSDFSSQLAELKKQTDEARNCQIQLRAFTVKANAALNVSKERVNN